MGGIFCVSANRGEDEGALGGEKLALACAVVFIFIFP